MTITEATELLDRSCGGLRKVRTRPGRMRVVGPTALLLLPLAACAPDAGGGAPAGADLSEHEIVYTSSAGDTDADLWLVKADGTDPVQLTDDPGLEFMAAWSPDGDRVADAAAATDERPADLFVLDLDGGEPRRHEHAGPLETAPTWTPDGEELVYASSDCDGGAGGIFATRLDGGEERAAGRGWFLARRRAGRTAALRGAGSRRAVVRPAAVGERAGRLPPAGRGPRGFGFGFGGDLVARRQADRLRRRGRDPSAETRGLERGGLPHGCRREQSLSADYHARQRPLATVMVPDGRRLVYSADSDPASSEVATVDLATLEVTPLTTTTPTTSSRPGVRDRAGAVMPRTPAGEARA